MKKTLIAIAILATVFGAQAQDPITTAKTNIMTSVVLGNSGRMTVDKPNGLWLATWNGIWSDGTAQTMEVGISIGSELIAYLNANEPIPATWSGVFVKIFAAIRAISKTKLGL